MHAAERVEPHRAAIEEYENLCARLGMEPTTVALARLLSRPGVTAPILGLRTPEQFDQAIAALGTELSSETLARLDELFPPIGKGGPRPGSLGRVKGGDAGADLVTVGVPGR
jgi:NDP-hexose 2,3-enoyl reductase